MFDNIKSAAAATARRTAFGLAAGLAMFIGFLFLTLAAWIILVSVTDSLTAAVVLGVSYIGIGLIFLAFALTRRKAPRVRHDALRASSATSAGSPFLGVAAAFFEGLGAGLAARDQFTKSQQSDSRDGPDRS